MIEFEHVITKAEVDSHYINLTDKHGNRYGDQIGKHGTTFKVIDEQDNEFKMKRHHGNQLTQCSEWFTKREIKLGAHITIRFDQEEGRIHLLCGVTAHPMDTSELGFVAFVHEGHYYQVRCTADAGVVRVRGSVDGNQVGAFEFTSQVHRTSRRRIREYE